MRLYARPLTLAKANAAVARLHRHHFPVVGHRYSIGAYDDGELVGVAIVGRPVARACDQFKIAEVSRLATNGHRNACSFLYAAAARAADAMGYESIQTYTLASEPGTSLRASGWTDEGPRCGGDGWQSRVGRRNDQPTCAKRRWKKVLRNGTASLPDDVEPVACAVAQLELTI